jgi:site-specific recombinase XerD
MYEALFSRPAAVQRHCEGPLAAERVSYLESLAAQGTPRTTIRIRADYCLQISKKLEEWPGDHRFTPAEVGTMAGAWAAESVARGRAAHPQNPERTFRIAAVGFLRSMGRLLCEPAVTPSSGADRIEAFITDQRQKRWQSEATCRSGRWKVVSFVSYLDEQGYELGGIDATDVDAYFQHLAQRLSRTSLRSVGTGLRTWLRYCETMGWTKPGLADALLLPRVYRDASLPLGPTWDQVGRMIAEASGDDRVSLRNRAILLLLSIYGLRSGEVRRLQLANVDWQGDRLHVVRSKSLRPETFPLESSVGNAIARYLRHGRPPSHSRTLFLTLRAPYRPLSGGALRNLVRRYLSTVGLPARGCGPHGLRHACARHLMEAGHSFKETGDHLGHRSPESTKIYVKVNLAALRLVELETLGGVA